MAAWIHAARGSKPACSPWRSLCLRSALPTPPRKSDADAFSTVGRAPPPPRTALRVLHSCDNYTVIDKHFDHRIYGNFEQTVEKLMRTQFPARASSPRPCHRLDYATSGAMLWAWNRKAAGKAGKAFARQRVKKLYLALVHGHLEGSALSELDPRFPEALGPAHSILDWPIADDVADGFRMRVGRSAGDGRPARTVVRLLARGSCGGRRASKVLLEPASGRRHQLRVHMHAMGHPIIGDATYTDDYAAPRYTSLAAV